MTMLHGRLALHNVDDVEALCKHILREAHADEHLPWHQLEDALAYLIAATWELSIQYNPNTHPRTSFRGWAHQLLKLRYIDWRRQQEGRTRWQFAGHQYERRHPTVLSLDHPTSAGHDQLDRAHTRGDLDAATHSSPDLLRALRRRGRRPTRGNLSLGQSTPRRAA